MTKLLREYWEELTAIAILAILILLAVFSPRIGVQPEPANHSVTTSPYIEPNSHEVQVNASRAYNQLESLTSSQELRLSACNKAQDMLDNDYWSHEDKNGEMAWHFFTEAGYDYKNAGENLAENYSNATETVDAWMASESHKANVLGEYDDQGICTKQNNKRIVTVQHLGTPVEEK